MVRAGFAPQNPVSVPVTKPEAVARSLLKYMSADDIAKLIAALVGAADLRRRDLMHFHGCASTTRSPTTPNCSQHGHSAGPLS